MYFFPATTCAHLFQPLPTLVNFFESSHNLQQSRALLASLLFVVLSDFICEIIQQHNLPVVL